MLKSDALILLIKSLTKSEKKAFRKTHIYSSGISDYLFLFDLIVRESNPEINVIKAMFLEKRQGSTFDASVKYLYKLLLDTLLDLRQTQDHHYYLLNQILKARVLFEKSLFEECFSLLHKVMQAAEKFENYHAHLLATKFEAEYLFALNIPVTKEKVLLSKQYRNNETLKIIRKINEHFALYELLKYRIALKGNIRSSQQKIELNDLVISEMSIVASSNIESFEIKKLHQLFQANYLLSVGDFKSAFYSFSELIVLFEANTHLWANPPIYYLLTIEGVLDSLRSIRNFDSMKFFVEKLKNLKSYSMNFNANVSCIIYLFELFPHLDQGNFNFTYEMMNKNKEYIYDRFQLLSHTRQAELSLYSALILFCVNDFRGAHKYINKIILKGKDFYHLPLYRTIRLVNLIILYELKDFDLIFHETRSIKREIKEPPGAYRIEKFMLKFLNKPIVGQSHTRRLKFWESMSDEIDVLRTDVFEKQVLKIFDFTAWIESKLTKKALSEVLKQKQNGQ